MTDLQWFELFPPRGLELEAITNALRPLASRPRVGLLRSTPTVVFELCGEAGKVRFLLGIERQLVRSVPRQMRAQLPELGVVARPSVQRPAMLIGCNLRLSRVGYPLRLDTASSVSAGLMSVLSNLGSGESACVQWVLGPSQPRRNRPPEVNVAQALGLSPMPEPTASDQQAWRNKAAEPLFAVRGRSGAATTSTKRSVAILRSLIGALSLANSAQVEVRASKPSMRVARHISEVRTPVTTWSAIVSAAELAQLIGWPLGDLEAPGHRTSVGRPPKELVITANDRKNHDRVVGVSLHPADEGQLVTMPLKTATHHLHIVGPTGSGKSHFLASQAIDSIQAGHGVLLIEPRGDLVTAVLERIPEHRKDDLVVIDPGRSTGGFVVGFNPLAGPRAETERRADELVHLFKVLYGSAIGPRSADVLFHALLTTARMEDGTLADVMPLLTSGEFRRKVLAKVTDPLTLGPWWARYEARSEAEKIQIVSPVANKLTALLSRESVRQMLGQGRPRFNLYELFTGRPHIVLINLNRGVVGPELCRTLGTLLLNSAWLAAQRRANLLQEKRFPVNLILDEWQDYVGALDFGEVLAHSRGLRVSINVAHQNFAQLDHKLQAAVVANCRSRLAFRPSQDDIRLLAAVFGKPLTPEDLERLGAFEAYARLLVDSAMTPPFAVKTLPLPPPITDPDELRRFSQQQFGVDGDALDASLLERWHGGTPDGPIGVKRRARG